MSLFQLSLRVEGAAVALLERAFEDDALAVSSFAIEGTEEWRIEALFAAAPAPATIAARLAEAGLSALEFSLAPVPERDWVAHGLEQLAPVHAGRFCVHGGHDRGRAPAGAWALQLEAGRAFGTGQHETTRGCLLALDRLARRRRYWRREPRILDLGTGSGVLAMAAARALGGRVLATDIDGDAVAVARENVRLNGLAGRVTVVRADGARHPAIASAAPYDLILANILARPLKKLAPAIARCVGRGGNVVLSGLLSAQAREVRAVYRAFGLTLAGRCQIGDWPTLILRKP